MSMLDVWVGGEQQPNPPKAVSVWELAHLLHGMYICVFPLVVAPLPSLPFQTLEPRGTVLVYRGPEMEVSPRKRPEV